jgi:hypothetical protein
MRILNCDLGHKCLEYISYKKKELSMLHVCLKFKDGIPLQAGFTVLLVATYVTPLANNVSQGKW